MLNDFTGGGQIFLHKIRMFAQVLNRSFMTSMLASLAIVGCISYRPLQNLDLKAAMTYQKAMIANGFDNATALIRSKVNARAKYYYTTVDAYDQKGLYARDIDVRKIIRSSYFKNSYDDFFEFLKVFLLIQK